MIVSLVALAVPANAQSTVSMQAQGEPSLFPMFAAWGVMLPSTPAAAPAADVEQVYVPLEPGVLLAVSLADGSVRWSTDLGTRVAPAVGEGRVYVATADAIHAVETKDGRVAWTTPVAGAITSPIVWDSGWLIVTTETGEVIALNGTSGQEVWRRNVGSSASRPAALAGPHVYLALDDYRIISLDIRTGAEVWQRRLEGVGSAILALDDRLFVGSTDNFFYCLSTRDGNLLWRWRAGADITGQAAVDTSQVYVASLDGLLRALDRGHGAQRWKRALPMRPLAGPLVAGDLVLLTGLAPEVQAYSRQDGKPAQTFTLPNLQPSTQQVLAAPPIMIMRPPPEWRTLVMVTREGQLFAARRTWDPPLAPLSTIPGKTLPAEPLPRPATSPGP